MLMIRAAMVAFVVFGWMSTATLWSDVEPKVLVEDLSIPTGIAVQPETGHVFVAERGRGRIVRILDGKSQPVIVGLPQVPFDPEAASPFRPIGLDFIDRQTLVLAVSAADPSDAAVYVAQVPDAGAQALPVDSLLRLGRRETTKDASRANDFLGVAASKSAIYITESDRGAHGWVLQADIRSLKEMTKAESFGPVIRFIAMQDDVKPGPPAGITLSSRGEIVVGHVGGFDRTRDSHLSFYRSTDGRLLLSLETGLFDIVAVQYGAPQRPSNKASLYVLDLAINSPELGGLYRLDAEFRGGKQGVRPIKIASLDWPAAMTRGNDGSMYVAIWGSADGDAATGKVLQFEPGL